MSEVVSVNGKTGAVVLTAANVEAVPESEAGQPNGVATLDSSGKLAEAQIPSSVARLAPAVNSTGLIIGGAPPSTEETLIKVEGTYADSSEGIINPISSIVENTGSRATVAVYAEAIGSHVWGINAIGQTKGEKQTAIGIELDFGHLTKDAETEPETSSVAYGLDIAYFPHKFPSVNVGSFIQMSAKHNAGGANLGCEYGVLLFESETEARPIAATGTGILLKKIECAVGIDLSAENVFSVAALKLGDSQVVGVGKVTGTSIGKAGESEKLIIEAENGIGPSHGQKGFYDGPGGVPPNNIVEMGKEKLYLNRFFTDMTYSIKSVCMVVNVASASESDKIGFAIYLYEPSTEKLVRVAQTSLAEKKTNKTGIKAFGLEAILKPLRTYYMAKLAIPISTGPTVISYSGGNSFNKMFWPGITGESKEISAAVKAPWAEGLVINEQTSFPEEVELEQAGNANNPVCGWRTFT